jgi:hypothetical protein
MVFCRMFSWGVMLGAWALVALPSGAVAQSSSGATPKVYTTKDYWEQSVLRRGPATHAGPTQTPVSSRTPQPWSPVRPKQPWAQVETVSEAVQPDAAMLPVPEGDLVLQGADQLPDIVPDSAPMPADEAYTGEAYPDEAYYEPGGCATCGAGEPCGTCGPCDGGCGVGCSSFGYCSAGWGGPECVWQGWWHRHCCWVRNLYLFAGVHGFKGPADQGRNGNFGFHEGLNWGAPLGGPWGLGYQLGMQAVHSNFSGDQADTVVRTADRNQIFFTGGLFRRALCGGWQGGVVFDLLHDDYYGTADLRQIRTESALVFSGCREIGFWGNFGVGDDAFEFDLQDRLLQPIGPNDTYSLFYRRHFSGGGQGRGWVGLSGNGEAVLGADCTIPLGTSWALENNFIYLIPKEGHGDGGQQDETWSVSIQLVWYPGRQASRVFQNPFQPLFSVADNSHFLLDRR